MSRAPLTRSRILQTALEMADRDGLDAVTLRRLASWLRVHVTSLYNHVPTRDAVTEGIVELLMEGAQLPMGKLTWRQWVRGTADSIRGLAAAHPGAFEALYRKTARGGHTLASGEAAVIAFEAAGFTSRDAYQAMRATWLGLLGLGIDEVARRRPREPGDPTSLVAGGDRYPALRRAAEAAGSTDRWSYLVETMIAGLATWENPA